MAQLSDEELDAVMTAAWALPPGVRAAFEQQVMGELQNVPPATRGPGTLHRVIATVQRAYLTTAVGAIGVGNLSKYGRASLRPKGNSR